jgi:hypothetical protein
MISKKRRHKGLLKSAPPTTGRAVFRGILHPLILGGQSIAPSSTATTANFDPYSQATVTVPSDAEKPSTINFPCELSATEKEWCDINPAYSWCKKANVLSNDPLCIPTSQLDMERARKNKADWINTRSCVLEDPRPGGTTSQVFGNGCFPAFRDAMPGDVRPVIAPFIRNALFGPTARLLRWEPDKPAI